MKVIVKKYYSLLNAQLNTVHIFRMIQKGQMMLYNRNDSMKYSTVCHMLLYLGIVSKVILREKKVTRMIMVMSMC